MRTPVLGGKQVPVVLALELVRRASVAQRQERLDVVAKQLRQPRAGGSIELVGTRVDRGGVVKMVGFYL